MQILTSNQLQHINQFLIEQYRLYYIDIQSEVADHIASDIEVELQSGKSYEEAFVLVFSKWDALLKPAKGFFRGIPRFVANQWSKDRLKRGAKACLFGVLTTLLLGGVFFRWIDLDENILWGIGTLLALYVSLGIFYWLNRNLVKEVPLHTVAGTFLRVEFKRLGWVQSVFVIMPLLGQMKLIPQGELIFYSYLFLGFVMLFYLIHWRIDYQKEKLYQIKWKTL